MTILRFACTGPSTVLLRVTSSPSTVTMTISSSFPKEPGSLRAIMTDVRFRPESSLEASTNGRVSTNSLRSAEPIFISW